MRGEQRGEREESKGEREESKGEKIFEPDGLWRTDHRGRILIHRAHDSSGVLEREREQREIEREQRERERERKCMCV